MTVDAIIDAVAETAPEIRGGLSERRRATREQNPSQELQLEADVWADEMLADRLSDLDGVGAYASEERENVIDAGDGYSVTLDPLDGSSNLKSNNSMGTILGVYDADLPAAGRDLVAAAYVLYGPITTMVVAEGETVSEYVIEEDGQRRLVTPDLTLPDDPVVYGFGGRVPDWTPDFTAFAREIETELKLRYGGAFIGDVNQVLTYGGVFAYPELESAPEGKLRLQFEGNPVGYIVSKAGGRASHGTGSLLEITPDGLHQRTPVYVGNTGLIQRRERL